MGGYGSGPPRRTPAAKLKAPEWRRQPHESHQAFEAFTTYLEVRGLERTANRLEKSCTLMGRWSTMWRWRDRTVAYDNEIQRIEMETQAAARVGMRKRHLQVSFGLQTLGLNQLEKWVAWVQDPENEGRDLSTGEMQSLIDAGVRLERLNRGDAESVTEERKATSFADLARLAEEEDEDED